MYEDKNPYHLGNLFKMKERCSNCAIKYKMEPSFFYGAMYVSYPVGIIFAAIAFAISFLLLDASLITTFVVIVITMVSLLPVIIRLSRNIWINFFFKYDSETINS